jgi:hypothetical protein
VQYGFPSPNGRYLAYQDGALGDEDVHLYDSVTDQNVCVSCPSDGSTGGAARLTTTERTISNRVPQVVTDDGQVFFDTRLELLASDRNGARDVYSYHDGKLELISPGDGNFDAFFADASADGKNVFFVTGERLVGQDGDGALDVYDARVGGGFPGQSPPPPSAPCSKTDCAEGAPGPRVSPPVVAPPQPPGRAAKRSNQERVTLSLAKVVVGEQSLKITFRASQRGRVRVTGSRVYATVRNVTKTGTYSISVPLSKKARSLRHAHKKFKVSVKVTLSGGWGSASAKYSRTLGK